MHSPLRCMPWGLGFSLAHKLDPLASLPGKSYPTAQERNIASMLHTSRVSCSLNTLTVLRKAYLHWWSLRVTIREQNNFRHNRNLWLDAHGRQLNVCFPKLWQFGSWFSLELLRLWHKLDVASSGKVRTIFCKALCHWSSILGRRKFEPCLAVVQLPRLGELAFSTNWRIDSAEMRQRRGISQAIQHLQCKKRWICHKYVRLLSKQVWLCLGHQYALQEKRKTSTKHSWLFEGREYKLRKLIKLFSSLVPSSEIWRLLHGKHDSL